MVDIMEEVCQLCRAVGKHSKLKIYQINLKEAIKLCEDDACNYPIGLDRVVQRNLDDVTVPSKRRQSNRQLSINHTMHPGFSARLKPPSLSSQAPLNVIRPQPVTLHPEPSQFIRQCPNLGSLEYSSRLKDCSSVNKFQSPMKSTDLLGSWTGFVPVKTSLKSTEPHSSINDPCVSGFSLPLNPTKTDGPSYISPELELAEISAVNINPQKSTSSLSSFHCVKKAAAIESDQPLAPDAKSTLPLMKIDSAFITSNSIDNLIPISKETSSNEVHETLLSLETEMDIDTSEVTEVIDIHLSLDDLKKGMSAKYTEESSKGLRMLELSNVSPLTLSVCTEAENLPSSPFVPVRSNQGPIFNVETSDACIKPIRENDISDAVLSQEVEIETSPDDGSQTFGDGTTYLVVETNKRGRKMLSKTKEAKHEKKKSYKSKDNVTGDKCENNGGDHVTMKNPTEVKKLIHKQLPSLEVFKFYPQWQNEEALCWLDVVLCLFVHSRTIRELECEGIDLSKTILVTLFKAYHQACQLVNKYREKCVQHQLEVASRTRSGRLFSDLDESDSDSVVESPNTELLKDMRRVNPNAIKTGAGLNCSKDFLSMLNTDEQTNYKDAFTILKDIRESIWNKLQPRLQCVKGKNDSPVLAIPLLVKDSIHVEKKFAVTYDFLFSCTSCGYKQVDRDRKVLPTFPSTTDTFSMKEPAFLRPCFKCDAPDQKRVMKFNKLPGVMMLHFAEGLPHNNLKKLEFWHNGLKYTVTGFVQYRNDPDHFVTWIRKSKDNRWIEFDDLKSPICRFESGHPEVDASQIHIVMWESCKQVDVEIETNQSIDAKNVQVVSPNGASIRGDKLLKEYHDDRKWSDSLKKTVLDLTGKKSEVKPHTISTASDTDFDAPALNVLKTIMQNSQVKGEKKDWQKEADDKSLAQRREALAKLWKPKPSTVTQINSVKEKRLKKVHSPIKKHEKRGKKKCETRQTVQDNQKKMKSHLNEWKPVDKLQFNEQKYCGLLMNGRKPSESSSTETVFNYAQINGRKSSVSSNGEEVVDSVQTDGSYPIEKGEKSFTRKSLVSAGTSMERFTSSKRGKKLVLTNGVDTRNSRTSRQSLRHGLSNGRTVKSDITLTAKTSTKSKYLSPLYCPKSKTASSVKSKNCGRPNINDRTVSIGSPSSSRSSSVAGQFSMAPKPFSGFRSKTFSGYQSGSSLPFKEVPKSPALSVKNSSNDTAISKRKTSINNFITVKRLKPQFSVNGTPFSSGFNTPCYGNSALSSPVLAQRGKEGDILQDLYSALDLLPPEKQGCLDLSAIESEGSGVCLQTMDDFLDQIL